MKSSLDFLNELQIKNIINNGGINVSKEECEKYLEERINSEDNEFKEYIGKYLIRDTNCIITVVKILNFDSEFRKLNIEKIEIEIYDDDDEYYERKLFKIKTSIHKEELKHYKTFYKETTKDIYDKINERYNEITNFFVINFNEFKNEIR